jgi:hypothetical protein
VTDAFTRARYAEESIAPDVLSDAATRLQNLRRLLRRKRRVTSSA